jgi:hypothetical protein
MPIAVPPLIEPLPEGLVLVGATGLVAVGVDELTGGAGKFESGLDPVGETAGDEVEEADADEDFLPPTATATPGARRPREIDTRAAAAPLPRRVNE